MVGVRYLATDVIRGVRPIASLHSCQVSGMPNVETFDFSTRESHEVYRWLVETRRDHVEKAIRRCLELGTDDITGEVDDFNVAEHLAEQLEEFITEEMTRAGYGDFGAGPLDELQAGDILAARLMRCVRVNIDFPQIAEGLLRRFNGRSED